MSKGPGGNDLGGLAELAAVMMDGAQRRTDLIAQNVSNMHTPAYRAARLFARMIDPRDPVPIDVRGDALVGTAVLKGTGNPLDIATDSGASLMLKGPDGLVSSRSAQLLVDGDGRLVDTLGRALQAEGGGDLVVGSGAIEFLTDGTVLVGGQAEGKVGLFSAADAKSGGVADALSPARAGVLHVGAVVTSDVDLGSEMAELTKAARQAETGARIFSIADDILGQASSRLGDLSK